MSVRGSMSTIGASLLGLLLVGCAANAPAPSDGPSADEAVYGGFAVDPPAPDEVVLTVIGTSTIELTLAEIDALAGVVVTFVEPFVGVEQTFRAVRLADLLEPAGIVADDIVDTIALNDYRYSDRAGALMAADALVAVARDGAAIPMHAGGPIRLVFAADSSYHGELDAWNWSLRTITLADRG